MKDPLTPAELDDPDIPKQPDIDYDRDPNNRLVIVSAKATGLQVVFHTRPESKGKPLVVSGGQPLKPVLQTAVAFPQVKASLPAGLYKAQIPAEGVEKLFEVPGKEPGGAANVDL
jgi:hypothetical protein